MLRGIISAHLASAHSCARKGKKMACSVTITSVTGIPLPNAAPGAISAISVSGTANNVSTPLGGANTVLVKCSCFVSRTNPNGNLVAQVDAGGAWQITGSVMLLSRTVSVCQCAESITVIAAADDPNGSLCDFTWGPTPLSCAEFCGTAGGTATVGDCNPDGTRTVTFELAFTPALRAGAQYNVIWIFGDPNNTRTRSSGTAPAGGLSSLQTEFSYAAGTYPASAIVEITLSTGVSCPLLSVTLATAAGGSEVVVPACWPCPTVSWVRSASDPTQNVAVTGCAPDTAVAQAEVTVTWPAGTQNPPQPQGYTWFIEGPSSAASPGKWGPPSAPAQGASVSTANTWTDLIAGTQGPVDFRFPGTYTITVTVDIPGLPSNCTVEAATSFDVPACGTPCPLVTSLTATPASGTAPLAVTFQATVTGTVVNGFQWNFGDSTPPGPGPNPNTHTYASPGSYTASVTVDGPPGCSPSTGSTTVTVSGGGNGGGPKLGCAILLVIAVILILLGALAAAIGLCTGIFWLEVVGGIVAAVGLILFVFWVIFCAAFTSCGVMVTVQCLLVWMVAVVGPVMAALAWLVGGFLSPCFGAAVLSWAGWGTILVWLEAIMRKVHCEPRLCL